MKQTALFRLNLPDGPIVAEGKYPKEMTPDAVMARFRLARKALPDEVTVLEPIDHRAYPLSHRNTVFVAPNGSDDAPGTEAAPLATLKKAVELMAGKGGGTILLRGGVHRITETVALDARHSGTAESPLFIKAYDGERVTLTSNTPLSTDPALWKTVSREANGDLYDRLPEAARERVLYTRLFDHGLTAEDIAPITKQSGPPNLFVGDERYTLARYPNDTGDIRDLLYFTRVYDTGSVATNNCIVYWPWVERARAAGRDPAEWTVGWETRIPDEDERGRTILGWVNTGDIWYFGSCYSGWEFGYYNLALETEGQAFAHNADGTPWEPASGRTPYLGAPKEDGGYSIKSIQPNRYGAMNSGNSPAGHNTYYLFNAIEALDAPGEWFLDRKTGILYVYPTEAMRDGRMSVSAKEKFSLLSLTGVQHAVIDGIAIDGSTDGGIDLSECRSVMIQRIASRCTQGNAVAMHECLDMAVIHSDFSRAGGQMVIYDNTTSARALTPTGSVIQNCIFHDAYPTFQVGATISGYRAVLSHNYFQNTISSARNSAECIFEYNVYEGGSADVTDGGMIYTWGFTNRANHYRYNLIHMFHATHNAIYNDGTSGGHYTYGNTISFLGSGSRLNKGWYSSTGLGNVCFGNTMVLRNPYQVAASLAADGAEDGDILPAKSGDLVNESALFYYFFGEEHAGTQDARYYQPVDYAGREQRPYRLYQSEAGHWWYKMKKEEYDHYTTDNRRDWQMTAPAFVNYLDCIQIILAAYDDADCDYHPKYFYVPWYLSQKSFTYTGLAADTVVRIPQYSYLDDEGEAVTVEAHIAKRNPDGSITLTYEELAALERFARQPACCVISDNVLLGGTPTVDESGKLTDVADPAAIITDGTARYEGYVPTSRIEGNYFEYLYSRVLTDAEHYNYDLLPAAKEAVQGVLSPEGYATLTATDWKAAGPTYRCSYLSGTR